MAARDQNVIVCIRHHLAGPPITELAVSRSRRRESVFFVCFSFCLFFVTIAVRNRLILFDRVKARSASFYAASDSTPYPFPFILRDYFFTNITDYDWCRYWCQTPQRPSQCRNPDRTAVDSVVTVHLTQSY